METDIFSRIEIILRELNNGYDAVFLHGGPGTGKSYTAKAIKEFFINNLDMIEGYDFLFLAPTGKAANEIDGKTINSSLKLLTNSTISKLKIAIKDEKFKRNFVFNLDKLSEIKFVLIDEISMVNDELLDIVTSFLKKPKFIFIGDFYQLAPMEGTYSFFSKFWINKKIKNFELRKNMRQNDLMYIDIINDIRIGRNLEKSISFFKKNNCVNPVYLRTRNEDVNRINEKMQMAKVGKIFKFPAINTCNVTNFEELGLERNITVKEGEKIMFTRNDSCNRFFNGSMGKILSIFGDQIEIFSEKFGNSFYLERHITDIISVDKGKKIKIGEVAQFPIKLCYAITVHKVQGITLDSEVDVSFKSSFNPYGMALVALSRSKDYRKMNVNYLTKDVIRINSSVRDFVNKTKFEIL